MIRVWCFGYSLTMPAFMFPVLMFCFLPLAPVLALVGGLAVEV